MQISHQAGNNQLYATTINGVLLLHTE